MTNIKKRTYKHYRYPGVRPKGNKKYLIDFIDHNGKRRQKTVSARSEADAAQIRRNVLTERDKIKAGLIAAPEVQMDIPKLIELWDEFESDRLLKIRAGSMKHTTLQRCRNSFDNLIKYNPTLKRKRVNKILPSDLEKFMAYRKEMGYSPEGINVDLRKLKTLFNFAVTKKYIERSQFSEVSNVSVPKSDVRFLNEDELQALSDALDSLDLSDSFQRDARDLTLFYLYTGARASEALYPTFNWECDLKNSVRFPKTKRGKSRTIPKMDTVKAVLESRKNISGGPFHFTRDQVYNRVKFVMDKAKISDASTHTLRKTAGAWYYMATGDIFAASQFLGHSTVKVTEDHYVGLIQSLQVEYATLFEGVLNQQLQLGCNSEPKGAQNRQTIDTLPHKEKSPLLEEKSEDSDGGHYRIRTCDFRLVRAAL